jgi:hypothetical protein
MAMNETIVVMNLDMFAVIEPWHRSADDINLCLAALPGYTAFGADLSHVISSSFIGAHSPAQRLLYQS